MKANPRHKTLSLGKLITEVYDRFGARHAEALIWFALHGHPIFGAHSPGAKFAPRARLRTHTKP